MKKFKDLKKGDYITRVIGYRVESARITSIQKTSKDMLELRATGTETKEKIILEVPAKAEMISSCQAQYRYYADSSIITALRDGIEIGVEYARKQITDSFKPINPYFTVNGRPAE